MASKGSIAQGLIERTLAHIIGRFRFNTSNALIVTVENASGVTAASEGAASLQGTSHVMAQALFNSSYRRNLV